MIAYALDTDTVSYILKGNKNLAARLVKELSDGNDIVVPPVVLYEIRRWLLFNKSGNRSEAFDRLCEKSLIEDMEADAFEMAAAEHARLKREGYTLDEGDMLIAGYCLNKGYTLVTNNTKHYSLINGLDIEDWTATL